jgi:hypothetical protein
MPEFLSVLEELCAASRVERWPEFVEELRRLGIPSRFSKKNHRRKYECNDPIRQLLVLQLLFEAERDCFLNSVHTAAVIRLGRKIYG